MKISNIQFKFACDGNDSIFVSRENPEIGHLNSVQLS